MSASRMRSLRAAIFETQVGMAARMGFSFRGYQDLEAGRASFAPRHRYLLERVSLSLAVEQADASLAFPEIQADILLWNALSNSNSLPGFGKTDAGRLMIDVELRR